MQALTGRCACGAISFTVTGAPAGASVCHCTQCRKMSGFAWSSSYVPQADLQMRGPVKWVALSQSAKRGICPICGAFLFWKAHAEDTLSFSLGALEQPTGLRLEKHIFTAEKGDYYQIPGEVPQR
ncbi:GFA family protein [Cognatishimia sp. F0-27]|uniref:GFA family protein n=1 Tax=Cognatishimia sp. F0-27 TaxID=2816855 RepID=UPI001D0C4247|nr:GFA family protein [Cognatishimia sp. F0-27]MCC1492115.1 GFA family protein [Cognatishimia sp. F0-27]